MKRKRVPASLSLLFIPAAALALANGPVPLDDEGLGAVSAQDGLLVDFTSGPTGVSITQIDQVLDPATANEATLRAEGLSWRAVDGSGNLGGAAHTQMRLDVGSATSSSTPTLNVAVDLDRSRIKLNNLRHGGDTGRSFGTWALDASGMLRLQTAGGLLNSAVNNTYLLGELTDATVFYRQIAHPAPYLILNDMSAKWELSRGVLGITSTGLRQATTDNSSASGAGAVDPNSLVNLALDFDLLYKNPAIGSEATEFLITGAERPMMHFGWLGSIRNMELVWKPGGVWQGTTPLAPAVTDGGASVGDVYNTAAKTQGLNFSSRWDFVSLADATALGDANKEFRWQLGEASGSGADKSRVNFELGDWVRWNPALYGHNFPLIAIDALSGQQGPGGLCWGFRYHGPTTGACGGGGGSKQFVNIQPGYVAGFTDAAVNRTDGTAKSMALMIRDGNLMSYSRRVKFLERDAAGVVDWTRDFKWGLIYTFANVDANAYVYAGGNPGDLNGGLVVDLTLMSQTFAPSDNAATGTINESLYQGFNWDHGSHLMIADTDIDKDGITGETRDAMGIGLVSSSFMVLANDMRIWVKPHAVADSFYDGGIDLMSPQTRFALSTTFGGGVLPDATGSYGTGPKVIKASLIRLNFEGLLNARLSPAAPVGGSANPCSAAVTGYNCKNYLGYSWAMRFMDTNYSAANTYGVAAFSENTTGYAGWGGSAAQLGDYGSYLSFAEPNQPNVDVRLSNITGDATLEQGVIDIVEHDQDGDNTPKLRISHTMKLGAAAGARMNDAISGRNSGANPSTALAAGGQEFRVDRVLLGPANLGRIVVPSAQIYSSLTLRPQP